MSVEPASTEGPHTTGLLVTGDLLFSTKITGTAAVLGGAIQAVASANAALDRLRRGGVRCVVLDLGLSSLTDVAMECIVSASAPATVLAYGSHVDAHRLDAARRAGCTEVMPRSRLSAELPDLLRKYLLAGDDAAGS